MHSQETTHLAIRTYVFLTFLHLFAIIWGVHAGLSAARTLIDLLFPLTAGIVVVWACATDARARRAPLFCMIKFLMFLFWPFAGPLYLVRSRGWRGGLWALLLTFTLCTCYMVPALYCYTLRSGVI